MLEPAQNWSAPDSVMASLSQSLNRKLPPKRTNQTQNTLKQKKHLSKRVIEELGEEELFMILQELMDDNPEAEELLKDLYLKVEEIRIQNKFREI